MDLIERTWEELGHGIRATGYTVWVRTKPHVRKTKSGLWLPPKAAKFHGILPHLVTTFATVLSAGPVGLAALLNPGDVVAFKRLHFGYIWKLEPTNRDKYGYDEEYVGFIDANDVLFIVEEEEEDRGEVEIAIAS